MTIKKNVKEKIEVKTLNLVQKELLRTAYFQDQTHYKDLDPDTIKTLHEAYDHEKVKELANAYLELLDVYTQLKGLVDESEV